MARVLVIGAGVIGLSSAVRLAENGHQVAVFARDLPAETTSSVAAALWHPYRAWPVDRIEAWTATSYREYARLAESDPDSGVRMRHGVELFRTPEPVPDWAAAVPDFERSTQPRAGYAEAWRFTAPVIDMSDYLPWLAARLERLGGTVTRKAFGSLPDNAEVVVNATGLGARQLAGDHTVTPVRGQTVIVEQIGITDWTVDGSDEDAPVYVVPRLRSIVIGGTAEPDSWEVGSRPETAQRILSDADRLVPGLAAATVLRHRTGLRPARPEVRLEVERRQRPGGADQLLVHCYGHGGSGVTVAWGCADEVTAVLQGG